jgi:hypothetical protein
VINPISPRLSGIDALYEAIATVPIPGAPPQLSNDGAAVGLAFLDIALRQNHVRRLTERLTLVEHRTARCVTEVDISLGLLDSDQYEAGLLYQRLRSRGAIELRDPAGDNAVQPDPGKAVIWVPVSLARRTHAPIDVTNASDAKLPRLTQFETSRLLASAMYRLFRLILQSHPDAADGHTRLGAVESQDDELNAFLHRDHRTRWLIQAALVTLLTERNKPAATTKPAKDETREDRHCRDRARKIFVRYRNSLHEYIGLLNLVVNDYLLVVALDSAQEEHLLAFDSPLHIELKPRRSLLQWSRMANGPYWVRYETRLPANLRAYHLVAETEQDLEIDTMCLRTDADTSVLRSLEEDLRTLADRLRRRNGRRPGRDQAGPDPCDDQKVELELQACLVRLSELIRRRSWDASRANLRLPRGRLASAVKLAQAVTDGPVRGPNGEPGRLQDHPSVSPDRLTKAVKELREERLNYDFSVENEPPSRRAHVYWRRAPSRVDSAQYINVSASMFIRDISGYRSGSITAYVLSVVAIAYTLASLRFGTLWPFGTLLPMGWRWPLFSELPVVHPTNPAAAITVTLLVPGFLYTRLNLPQRHTIAGQLRRLPRFVAHATIVVAAAVATTFAAAVDPLAIQTSLALCMVIPLASVVLLHLLSPRIPREMLPITADTPLWARRGRSLDPRLRGVLRRGLHWRPRLRAPDSAFRTTSFEPDPPLLVRLAYAVLDWFLPAKKGADAR